MTYVADRIEPRNLLMRLKYDVHKYLLQHGGEYPRALRARRKRRAVNSTPVLHASHKYSRSRSGPRRAPSWVPSVGRGRRRARPSAGRCCAASWRVVSPGGGRRARRVQQHELLPAQVANASISMFGQLPVNYSRSVTCGLVFAESCVSKSRVAQVHTSVPVKSKNKIVYDKSCNIVRIVESKREYINYGDKERS